MKLSLLFYLFKLNSINSLSYTPYKYPYDPRIHNFGNVGIGGKFHANLARPITKVIDNAAYEGQDIREIIGSTLKKMKIETISDWACERVCLLMHYLILLKMLQLVHLILLKKC